MEERLADSADCRKSAFVLSTEVQCKVLMRFVEELDVGASFGCGWNSTATPVFGYFVLKRSSQIHEQRFRGNGCAPPV